MPDLIEKGHVYIANPPLFKVTKGKQIWHLYNETQLEDLLNEIGREKVEIQRYKGLGEMNSDELWETTMNPETRILTQLVIEDAEEIAATIEDLMGDDSEPRKELLQEAIHEMDFADLDL